MKRKDFLLFRTLFWIMFIPLMLYILGGELLMPDEWDTKQYEYQEFNVEWKRVYPDGTRVEFEIPGSCGVEKGERIILETRVPLSFMPHSSIMFWRGFDNTKVYVDGVLRNQYDKKDSRIIGDSSPSGYETFNLLPEDAGKKLTMIYTNNEAGTYYFQQMYYGDKMGMWMSVISSNIGAIIVAGLAILLALLSIVVGLILERQVRESAAIKSLGFGVLLMGIWVLANSSMRQIIFPNISIVSDVAFIVLGVLPLPFLFYINYSQNSRYIYLYRVCACFVFADFIIINSIVIAGYLSYIQLFPYIALGIVLTICLLIGTMIRDIFTGKIKEYKTAAISILILCVGGFFQLMGYIFSLRVSHTGSLLAVAMLAMMANALYGFTKDMMKINREKEDAIYASQAKAQFLANMSHEIRTPINAVLGMNEMILREEKDEEILGYSQDIQSAGQSLLALINDILDFSKIESGKMEIIPVNYDVASILNDSYNLIAQRARDKGLEVEVRHDAHTPKTLFGDEVRIRQIMVNLLTNGIKYTESGTVTIFLGFEELDDEHITLIIKVKDTGIGITEEGKNKLFDSFQRVDESRNRNIEGTGLGLSITKQLLDLMEGTISVESEYGKGSVFIVTIPQKVVSRTPVGDMQKKHRPTSKSMVHTMTFRAPEAHVLIVDDMKINLKVMEGLMKGTDIVIDSVLSGQACIEMMSKNVYDIIFLDHMMPEMDGVETLRCIHEMDNNLNENTPIIMLTANAIAGAREEYIEMGFSDYLSKPVQSVKLDEMLQHYLPEEKIIRM